MSFRYEQYDLKYNNPLIPLYFIVEYKGHSCEMEQYISQIQANVYGIPYFYPTIVGQKMKLKIYGCPTEFVNKKGTWICYCECSQSKIKACMQFMSRLNDVAKIVSVLQFGGKKLAEDKLKDGKVAKGKELSKIECQCPEIEYKYEKTFKISDKKQQMAMYMFQRNRMNEVSISGDNITVKSQQAIKQPTKSMIKRFDTKFSKIDPGKENLYLRQQGLLCGYNYQ